MRWSYVFATLMLVVAGTCMAARSTSFARSPVLVSDFGPLKHEVRLFDKQVFVSWEPRVEYRPTWAGQVNRYGFRYTRWSNGSAEIGVPLNVVAIAFAMLGCSLRPLVGASAARTRASVPRAATTYARRRNGARSAEPLRECHNGPPALSVYACSVRYTTQATLQLP
jgi:hypothetical protein